MSVRESGATAERPVLLDLVESSRWQRLQDHFARVLGIPIRTVSPTHELLVRPSWPTSLMNDQAMALLKAGEELEQILPSHNLPNECTSVTTILGATYAAVPVRATADLVVAYFVVGPVVVGVRENELEFRQRVTALELDSAALWPLILSLKLYTFASIRSVLAMMEEVGTSLTQYAYQAHELSGLTSSPAVRRAVASYYNQHVLRSLLEAVVFATRADGGSVMTLDPQGSLRIEAAQGLSEAIVASTRLKRGEGIAGLALAQRTILLLDDQTRDVRLTSRMQRTEVVSSIVAPLAVDATSEPFGVLSLRSTTPGKRFTQEHVELLRRLLDLAGVALTTLQAVLRSLSNSPSS